MSLLNKFKDNTLNSLRKPLTSGMLYMSSLIGLGSVFAPTQTHAQNIKGQYYLGYGQMSSEVLGAEFNPYATGGHLYAGGRISLSDDADSFLGKHGILMGEYSYQLADPNQYSYTYNGEYGGQVHHVSYSRIHSTATIAAGLNFTAGKFDITAAAGASWYPGNQHNWLNNANFTGFLEARYAIFNKDSPINLEIFSRLQSTRYTENLRNALYMPDGLKNSTTGTFGARLIFGN